MKVILAESSEVAMRWARERGILVPHDAVVIRGLQSIQGLRFRYEDVVRLPGWSKHPDIEKIEDVILRTHVTMGPKQP